MSIRALVRRVRRVEEARHEAQKDAEIGARLIAEVEAEIAAGTHDPRGMSVVLKFIRKYVDGAWQP